MVIVDNLKNLSTSRSNLTSQIWRNTLCRQRCSNTYVGTSLEKWIPHKVILTSNDMMILLCMFLFLPRKAWVHQKQNSKQQQNPSPRHFDQLLDIFQRFGIPGTDADPLRTAGPIHRYLFLGGYVDKGRRSLDAMSLLFLYKVGGMTWGGYTSC